MKGRHAATLLVAGLCAAGAVAVREFDLLSGTLLGAELSEIAVPLLLVAAVLIAVWGLYAHIAGVLAGRMADKRRRHNVSNVLRLAFLVVALFASVAVLTRQWVGLLFSLGVIGFAVTFALQQPLFSLIGWFYIVVKRPYRVGDRVAIEGSKGDVVDVDFLVTTLWEIDGELVASNQPSGRVITLPNSVVLSSHVYNYSYREFPHVWNELTVQVAYETDLNFAKELMREEATDYLGEEMAAGIARYRKQLAETPVELEVSERPSVNVHQRESWVELRLRYLVHPRRGQVVRNELYERILGRMNEHPDRVAFPVSRNR